MEVDKKRFAVSMIFMSLIGLWWFWKFPANLGSELENAFGALLGLHFFMQVLMVYAVSRSDADLFEPIMLVLILYYCIFVYRPIVDIINNDYKTFGIDPMSACPKSCVIVAGSTLSFCLAYYSKFKIKNNAIQDKRTLGLNNSSEQILRNSYVIWMASFVISVLNQLISGVSLSYILSMSMSGTVSDNVDTGIAALSFFTYSMIVPWMYILIYERRRLVKIVITFFMLCICFIRGKRIILIGMAATPILYYYLSRKKRPKARHVLIAVMVALFAISLMQFARHGVRFGANDEFSWEDFSSVAITNVFDADFTTYKQFYAIVEAYPSSYSYTMGRAIIVQTLLTMIPRAIWPGKPQVVILDVIKNAVNEQAMNSGMAAPNIGEYYFEFGVFGCVVFMFLVGKIFRHWKEYIASDEVDKWIMYSSLYCVIFQLIIRTSTASIVYQYIFTILPLYIIKKLSVGESGLETEVEE